ncbi:MAG: hypothetical protein L0Y72_23465 [Gemmataceae bacterium]|nr:hypothetical protein [Gemmataceae bacterium]
MNCSDFDAWLQSRLDGATLSEPRPLGSGKLSPSADAEEHLAQCNDCREKHQAAQRLLEGLQKLPWPASPGLAQRIVARVSTDDYVGDRTWNGRWIALGALAAAILILILAGHFWPAGTPTDRTNEPIVKKDAPPELAKSMYNARDAVASLTGKLAEKTKEQTQVLLVAAAPFPLSADTKNPPKNGGVDPAVQTLVQAGQGVRSGLEPVTRTARRAWDFFVRELTVLDATQ